MKPTNKLIKRLFVKNVLLVFLPVLLILLVLFGVIYHIQATSIRERAEITAHSEALHKLVLTDNIFSTLDQQMTELREDRIIMPFFEMTEPFSQPSEMRIITQRLRELSNPIFTGVAPVASVGIYSETADYLLDYRPIAEDKVMLGRIRTLQNHPGSYSRYYIDIQRNTPYVTAIHMLYEDRTFVGAVTYSLQYNKLMEILGMNDPKQNSIRLTDINGYEIINTMPPNANRENFVSVTVENGKGYQVDYVVDITQELLFKNILPINLLLLLLGCLILSSVLTLLVSFKIYLPFKGILKILYDDSYQGSEHREIIHLNLHKRNDRYFLESKLLARLDKLKKMQTVALQNQINPHFLSNTLQIVGLYAEEIIGEDNKISDMIVKLSSMLRYTFSTKTHITLVREELSYLRLYTDIQQERFGSSLRMTVEIPEELMEVKIAKITFQPIIENAIHHGRKNLSEIRVTGRLEGSTAVFCVTNDGIPIDSDVAEELNRQFTSPEIKEDQQIGLSNVNQRLHLIFGANAGLHVGLDKEGKTLVEIRIPTTEK